MNTSIYKLGRYKIIESGAAELRWEAHFGLGALQEGMCFKKGTILFIGPAESKRDGFLKLEFIDHLKRFPDWLKTKYYCENLEVFHCKTGKKVAKEEMLLWSFGRGIDERDGLYSEKSVHNWNKLSAGRVMEDASFRLQRYEIIKKTNGNIVWKTYAGPCIVKCGGCIILEDILFIGSWQTNQSSLDKRQFLANLQQMPKWDATRYYCPTLSLHDCKTGNNVKEEKIKWPGGRSVTEKHDTCNKCETTAELKISNGIQQEIFFTKIIPVLDSPAKAAKSSGNYNRFLRFKFKKPYIPKSISVFRTSGLNKKTIYIFALIFLIILLFIVFLIGSRKEHHERRHYEKDEHSSSHHGDH